MKHSAPGFAAGRAPIGYPGRHRRIEAGIFPAAGPISDRIRSTPELMELEKQPADRGESPGRYDMSPPSARQPCWLPDCGCEGYAHP